MGTGSITTTDGVTLHVETSGQGRPILFVAGYMATLATWAFQVDAVTAAGFQAVCVDRRSHGHSDRPAYGQRISRHAVDIAEVISALALDKPVLVGGSMGASVCWSYLDLFGPDGAAGMVSVDQTPRMLNGNGWKFGYYGLNDDNLGHFFDDGIPPTGKGRAPEFGMDALGRLMARVGTAELASAPEPETLALLYDHSRQDWRDVCARIAVPQLVVAARESQLWPCQHAAEAIASNPKGRYVIMEDCGHAANFEQPEAFNAELVTFLDSLSV